MAATRLLCFLGLAVLATAAGARVLLTQKEALELAFPAPLEVLRSNLFLTTAEQERAAMLAREPVPSKLVTRYEARRKDGVLAGTAYFDTHIVRTLPETAMIVVGIAGEITRVEMLSFSEPPEYIARRRWMNQFDKRHLDDDLSLKRGVRVLAGATLTARAMTAAARRVLALHQVIGERSSRPQSPQPQSPQPQSPQPQSPQPQSPQPQSPQPQSHQPQSHQPN